MNMSKKNPIKKAPSSNEFEEGYFLSPIRALNRLQEQMEQFMGWPRSQEHSSMALTEWSPTVDVVEQEKEYLLKAELPEVKKEDIKVTVEEGVLTISGERKFEKEETNKRYHRIERSYGSFQRSFTLPNEADTDKITSEFKDGVLTIHLPKNPETKPRSLDIKIE
jgi:HSP20 family protein